MPADTVLRMIYIGLLVVALAGWGFVELRRNFSRSLKLVLAWAMIFLGLMAVYGLWGDIQRGMRPAQQTGAGKVILPRAEDGHYYATLDIDGVTVTFMADTGASSVVLTPQDARRVGIDPARLAYVGQASTANGMVRTARVALHNVSFGPFHEDSLPASVNQGAMDVSLLGMEYLGRFQITIAGDRMVLQR
ncbi:TIGR02281 family clan AA aspartic protease [bacterium]|nr:TIGR02281 family clan AA aspartic protease [bacterium]